MMRGPKSGTASNLLLLLVCLLLATTVWLEIEAAPRPGQPLPPAPDTAPEPPPLPDELAYRPPALEDFREVAERPLFAPSRRPPADAPPPVAVAAPAAPELGFELIGVVISPAETLALVRQPGAPDLVRAGIGQTVAGWTVERIFPNRVLFRAGDRVEELALRDDVAPPPESASERRERRAEERRRLREERLQDQRLEAERLEAEERAESEQNQR